MTTITNGGRTSGNRRFPRRLAAWCRGEPELAGNALALFAGTMPRLVTGVCVLMLLAAAGCSSEPQAAEAGRPNGAPSSSAAGPAAASTSVDAAAPVPHGDHTPHHGGMVFMNGEMHFEVVLDRGGRHQIFFSDATRADLPASVASAVSVVVTRPTGDLERIAARIDETGESWRADGQMVGEGETTARVSFVASGEPYWIDIPFVPGIQ